MKRFTDFSKLKVGDYFLSVWKNGEKEAREDENGYSNKRISLVKKINKKYLIRDVWTFFGSFGDTKNNRETHNGWNDNNYNFYKLNKEEIKIYKNELTLRELETDGNE